MSSIPLKKLFHAGDSTNSYDEVVFFILSLLILIPLGLFLYGVFCMIMCLVQEICIV